jgi:DNA-binding IclR family transcriptional regulator
VASRVLGLLGAFDPGAPSLSLTELAQRAQLAVPTAHRLVAELVEWGALVRLPSGQYMVGRRIWDLALLAPVNAGIREIASPFLYDLYATTLATVHLAERDGTEVLYLDRLAGRASVPVVSRVGSRLPMHATAVGKVLLAAAPVDVQRHVFGNLTRVTPFTVTQAGVLAQQLRRVVAEGYAQTTEEMSLGACSLAVPIRDAKGVVVAALGLVVPSLKRDRPRLVAALQVTAQGISRRIAQTASAQ